MTSAGEHRPDDDQEIDVDQQAARADQAEAEDIDRFAAAVGHNAHHPDQYADHDDGERQLEHRPGDGAEKNALGLHHTAIMRFETFEHAAERAGLLADQGHFAKKRWKHVAGASQRHGQTVSVGNRIADLGKVRLQPAACRFRLALPCAADVDAGVGLNRQPMAEIGERFVRELRL